MIEEVRCPQCGARNGADAEWCTQCYARLTAATAEEAAAAPSPPASPRSTAAAGGGSTLASGDGRFRQTEDGLEWRCATCEEWNPIERLSCAVCSTPFGTTPADDQQAARPDVPAALLVGGSLVLPGLGHWLLGLRGTAFLRGLLALVWGLGGLLLLLRARASGQSVIPAVPLLLGWAVVAAGSANDAHVEGGATGQRALNGRRLLWLTVAVVGGTFVAVLVGVLAAAGG